MGRRRPAVESKPDKSAYTFTHWVPPATLRYPNLDHAISASLLETLAVSADLRPQLVVHRSERIVRLGRREIDILANNILLIFRVVDRIQKGNWADVV